MHTESVAEYQARCGTITKVTANDTKTDQPFNGATRKEITPEQSKKNRENRQKYYYGRYEPQFKVNW